MPDIRPPLGRGLAVGLPHLGLLLHLLHFISQHHQLSTHCTVNHQFRHHLLQWSPTVVEAARPRALADGARPHSPSVRSHSRSNKRQQQCATCARARTALPRRRRPPTGVADPSVGAPPGRTLGYLPWRPTSSGTRRRGDSRVLNEIPSAHASLELRFCAPSH
ncbi:formin-like protein 5 [Iris pallida]|uniref:Formin-like protein 5 n=1 Tax=Iris pallida TaxID=29817 RepID=A0AAX6GTF9_IRIPA|nr:formin-like protein 5 [Iris pallida]